MQYEKLFSRPFAWQIAEKSMCIPCEVMRCQLIININVDLVFAYCIFAAKVLGDEVIHLQDIVADMTQPEQMCQYLHMCELKYMQLFFNASLTYERFVLYFNGLQELLHHMSALYIQQWWRKLELTPKVQRYIPRKKKA